MGFLTHMVEDFIGGDDSSRYKNQQQQQGGQGGYPPQMNNYSSYQDNYNSPSQPSGAPPNLPPGWAAEWDPRDNQWIYFNDSTGERTYEVPSFSNMAGYEVGRAEERFDYDKQRVEDVPEDLAADAGYEVGRAEERVDRWKDDVEDVPEDIAGGIGRAWGKVERFGDEVEDIPGDIAYDVGEGVGDVQRFGDEERDAYDEGRDEGRDGW